MDGAGSPQGLREDLLALARDALLDHLARGDARAVLGTLIERLSQRCGTSFTLAATGAPGEVRWRIGPATAGAALTLQHGPQTVGLLTTMLGADRLEPVLPVLSALLAADARAAAAGDDPSELDTSTRHAIASAAAQATERLERIARHVPGVLYTFVMKPDGRTGFEYASERIHEFFGVPVTQATGRFANIFALVEPEDRGRVAETAIDSAQRLTEWQQDFRVRRADGVLRWFRATSTPRREPDGSTIWYGYMQDVTDQHALQEAQRQAEVAAAANKAKTEFLSRMSHELRTPLNAVLGFTQLMEIDRAEPPTEGQRRRLKLIREAGDHLLRMIGDLLDLTRIEQGGMALTIEPVALRPLVADCVGLLQPAADAAQVRIELPTSPEVRVLADRTRLQQVLMNLLSNAIKYNRPGGRVALEITTTTECTVVLVVRDSGVGIEQEVLPRLFEPFYRGAQARGSIEGTGIGLSLTRSLVLLMSGSIEVCSEPGVGSTFTVTLPEAAATAPAAPTAQDPH